MPTSSPLRLFFCLFRYFPHGGLQRDMLQIAQACTTRGHRIEVLTQSWTGPPPAGIEVTCIDTRARTNHGRARQFSQNALQRLRQQAPDGVIGFNKMPGLDVYYAADGCLAARPDLHALARWLPRYRQYRCLETAVFSPEASTVILALTPSQQQDYQRCYRTPADRFIQLPPNLAAERRRPAQATLVRSDIRRALGVSPHQALLLQIGSSFRTKGLDRSLRALAALPVPQRERTVLVIAGSDKLQPWQRIAKKLGVHAQVQFLGPRQDVMDLMLGADLLLQPSRRESAGIVLLEALVAGLPAIVSGACGYGFHVQRAGSGWVLPEPFVQADFSQHLQDALVHADLVERTRLARDYAEKTPLYGMVDTAVAAIEQSVRASHAEAN